MDVVADVLSATRNSNRMLCGLEFEIPWGVIFDTEPRAHFHFVSRGTCWLRLNEQTPPIQLSQGDVALVPFGGGHILSDSANTSPLPLSEALASMACNLHNRRHSESSSTTLICGGYYSEHDGKHPLLSLLPDIIHIPAAQTEGTESLQAVLRLIDYEICNKLVGADTVASRLVDILLVCILRAWLAREPELPAGWLTALKDPPVGQALSLMHREPERHWTVETLAREVHVSRAMLAKRFTQLVGEPPLSYLTRLRMDIAARMLRESEHVIWAIAQEVGYETEASLSKAFRRTRGLYPGQYRAKHRVRQN